MFVAWCFVGVMTQVLVVQLATPRPAAAEHMTGLRWGPCPRESHAAGAACTTVSVPMDYSAPTGRRIDIMISRIQASDPAHRRGVLFGNPGGPGGDALNFWVTHNKRAPARLHAEFDEIAVQPRGLRWSTPLDCSPPGMPGMSQSMLGEQFTMGGRTACEEHDPQYPATITTETTAQDMDEVRRALGLDRIDFLGGSYGTYLGAVYASLFPRHIDKLVLDSNVNPAWVWQEEFAEQQLARQTRLNDLFGWIAANNRIYRLGDTANVVAGEWTRQIGVQGGGPLRQLADLLPYRLHLSAGQLGRLGEVVRAMADPMGATGLTFNATLTATYARAGWPYLAEGMREYRDNPKSTRFLDYLARLPGGDEPSHHWVFAAITCNENAIPPDPGAVGTALAGLLTGADVFKVTAALLRAGVGCSGWTPLTTPVPLDGSRLAVRPMVLQSAHDTATAPAGGPAMAAAMGGHLVRVAGGDHGVFGRGDQRLDDAVLYYLETGVVTIDHAGEAPITTPNPPTEVPHVG